MRFHLSEKTKWKMANKVTYNVFLRLLIFKFWFRVAVASFLILLLFLGLFLPKIWTATPAGQLPVVKISGLNKLQAWSLKSTARQEMSAGRSDRAHFAWMGAIAHNPGDPESFRGLITNLLTHPTVPPMALRNCLGNTLWLLHLTSTNSADLDLAIALLDEYYYSDWILNLLSPRADHLTPREEAAYLKALFLLHDMPTFGARWEKVHGDQLPDPELPLYWAAYTIGWGKVELAPKAREQLAAALKIPARQNLVNHLLLSLSAKAADLAGYETALKRLEDAEQDNVFDHVNYWALLDANGRRAEACRLAKLLNKVPASLRQRVVLAEAYSALDLPDLAQRFYEDLPVDAVGSEELWASYARFLARNNKWDSVRGTAVEMRTRERVSQDVVGYTYFLEGWAEHELGRVAPADEAFRKMNQTWLHGSPQLALVTSVALVRLGRPAPARDLLLKFEDDLSSRIEYWRALFDAANALKDPALLLTAAKKETDFLPDEVATVNHYAAALLANRIAPETAVKLTLRILNAFPNAIDAHINHSLALLLNHRTAEAREILARIQPGSLKGESATSFYMASFQVCCERGEFADAWQMADRIDLNLLFPAERTALDEARKKLPPREQAKL